MEQLSLSECFAAYAKQYAGRDKTSLRKLLAQFVGVSHDCSAVYWLRAAHEPAGATRWKAVGFFNLCGYKVTEFENLRSEYRLACKLLAYGLVDATELAREFGYTGKQPGSRMYQTLESNGEILAESMSRLKRFVQDNAALISEAEHALKQEYAAVVLVAETSPAAKAHQTVPEEKPSTDSHRLKGDTPRQVLQLPAQQLTNGSKRMLSPMRQLWIQHAAQQLAGLQPLLDWLANEASPKERDQFRELLGPRTVFDIANDLNHLCSETANNERGM